MDPITIAALAASAIPAIGKLFGGGSQVRKAKALDASNVFTPYQTPSQVLEATRLAQQAYTNPVQGQATAINNIQGAGATAFANGVQGASSSGDVLDLASKVQANENNAFNKLNTEAIGYRDRALNDLTGALNNEAQYADKEYQVNVLDPYLRKANLAASMYGAGKINQSSGLDSLATTALAGATAYSNYKKSNGTTPKT